jgi:hypothetical protein
VKRNYLKASVCVQGLISNNIGNVTFQCASKNATYMLQNEAHRPDLRFTKNHETIPVRHKRLGTGVVVDLPEFRFGSAKIVDGELNRNFVKEAHLYLLIDRQ